MMKFNQKFFETMRRKILIEQSTLSADIWNICIYSRIPEYAAIREIPEDLRSDERSCGMVLRHKLLSFRFRYCAEEPLIGRLEMPQYSEALKAEADRYFANSPQWGISCGQTGHCEPDYQAALDGGLDALRTRIQAKMKATSAASYENFLMALEGLAGMIEHAAETADKAGNPEVAAICRKVAHQRPDTFREAIQLLWFIALAIQHGDRAGLINPGRLDRTLLPFYGNITRKEAAELLSYFYLLINSMCQRGLAYGMMIGGSTPVNDISYATLDALRISRLVYPSVGVCVNENTPHDLLRLTADIIAEGIPNPSFFNDHLIRKGMEYYGVPPEKSGEYINSTCVEITPCGASNVYVASPYYNLNAVLLEVMNREYDSFDALMQAFKELLAVRIAAGVEEQNELRRKRAVHMRRPLQSVFTRSCIDRGRDIEEGGADYNWVECYFVGLANLVDSLTVIRHEVFEEKNLSMGELLHLCQSNFADNEALRFKFLNHYPKYGQNVDEVDRLIPEVITFVVNECAKYKMFPDNAHFIPGTFCWEMHQRLGAETDATPDGRRGGFPFADGAGPAQGREKFGPTSAVCFVCSWSHLPLIGGSAFNMKYSKGVLTASKAREKLIALVKTFIQGGGFQTQINVVDQETLQKADKDPEAYPDLVVRIGGYTDYFARLSEGMRKEVLLRMQYDNL